MSYEPNPIPVSRTPGVNAPTVSFLPHEATPAAVSAAASQGYRIERRTAARTCATDLAAARADLADVCAAYANAKGKRFIIRTAEGQIIATGTAAGPAYAGDVVLFDADAA